MTSQSNGHQNWATKVKDYSEMVIKGGNGYHLRCFANALLPISHLLPWCWDQLALTIPGREVKHRAAATHGLNDATWQVLGAETVQPGGSSWLNLKLIWWFKLGKNMQKPAASVV